ncbi:hypothetical protein [Longimycelium tulufanense]|nr:hypothetical protein [Longimycelium tulufanense]
MITQWTETLGIPVIICRGFGSQSYVDQVRDRVLDDGRPAVLLYVGDWDASGEDIQRDWMKRTGCWSVARRLAVTKRQANGLPSAPAKQGDPRWPKFAARHGYDVHNPVQWEVEALPPERLRRLVLAAVDRYLDRAQFNRVLDRERREQAELAAFVRQWRDRSP